MANQSRSLIKILKMRNFGQVKYCYVRSSNVGSDTVRSLMKFICVLVCFYKCMFYCVEKIIGGGGGGHCV